MRINITGKHRTVDHAMIRKALQFYAKELMPKLHTKVTIDLEIQSGLVKSEGMDGGVCWVGRKTRPRRFIMDIEARMGMSRTLRILAHEMVHVAQFAQGKMIDMNDDRGVMFHGKYHVVHDDDRYWTQPWEIEAYGREPGLYHRFKRDNKL